LKKRLRQMQEGMLLEQRYGVSMGSTILNDTVPRARGGMAELLAVAIASPLASASTSSSTDFSG
jgi:hypothetical protein